MEGIASILFETRLGCLQKKIPAGTQDFINAIGQMFTNSVPVMMTPKWSRHMLPYYHRYIGGWEGIFDFGELDQEMRHWHQVKSTNSPTDPLTDYYYYYYYIQDYKSIILHAE